MSFWKFWSREKEKAPAEIRMLCVNVGGKWQTYFFVAGSLDCWKDHLRFTHPHGGVTWFAPAIWSTAQTFSLSEECQARVRDRAKTETFDGIAEEKLKT